MSTSLCLLSRSMKYLRSGTGTKSYAFYFIGNDAEAKGTSQITKGHPWDQNPWPQVHPGSLGKRTEGIIAGFQKKTSCSINICVHSQRSCISEFDEQITWQKPAESLLRSLFLSFYVGWLSENGTNICSLPPPGFLAWQEITNLRTLTVRALGKWDSLGNVWWKPKCVTA